MPDAPQLAARTYTELVLCDGGVDSYRVAVPEGTSLRVVLRHAPEDGDLALALFVQGERVHWSDDRLGVEVAGLDARDFEREVVIEVTGRPGASVSYSLGAERLGAEECMPDGLEGFFGNDDADHARALGFGEHALRLCPADEDWFSLDLPPGARVQARASLLGPPDAASMTLFDPDGQLLAESTVDDPWLVVAADVATPGRHLLRVAAADPADRLDLTLLVTAEAAPGAAGLACARAATLEAGQPSMLPGGALVPRFGVSCGDLGEDGEGLVRFELAERAQVALAVEGAMISILAIRDDCEDPGSEVACGIVPEGQSLEATLDAGTWFVVVKTVGPPAAISLAVTGPCQVDGECGDGERCVGGSCRSACEDNAGCVGAQICNENTGHCVEPDVCEDDVDCLAARVCEWESCIDPECSEHADCQGACVDRLCLGAPPAACDEDGDCPGQQACVPLGACLLDGECADDGDCPRGAPLCDGAGRCVACVSDDDCAGAGQCEAGRCSHLGGCGADEDCPGDQTCAEDGRCAPVPCAGDRLDRQPPPPRLRARTYGGLVLCDGSVDVYQAHVSAEEGLSVVLRHAPGAGDLALELYTIGELGPLLLGHADDLHGVEALGVDAGPLGYDVDVVVSGPPGASVEYSLTLERLPADECVADPFEGLLGNDDSAHAAQVGLGGYDHTLCPGDEDWFSVSLPAGARLTLSAAPEGVEADEVELTLLAPGGDVLTEGADGGDGSLTAEADSVESGPHRVRVRAPQAAARIPVHLAVEAAPAPDAAELACQAALPLVADEPIPLPATEYVPRLPLSCGEAGEDAEHVARFELEQAASVTLEVVGAPFYAMGLRDDCDDEASDVACELLLDQLAGAVLEADLAAGTWFVVVKTSGARSPELLLLVEPGPG